MNSTNGIGHLTSSIFYEISKLWRFKCLHLQYYRTSSNKSAVYWSYATRQTTKYWTFIIASFFT